MTVQEQVALLISFSAIVDVNPLDRPQGGEELQRRGVRTFTLYPQHMEGPKALSRFIRAVQRYVPQPLFNIDQEGGRLENAPWLTSSPGNMALGAVAHADRAKAIRLAQSIGQVTGKELRAVGIRWNFAPVGDVNINPANPVIGTRSFGEDPSVAADLVTAYVKGLQSAGVAATVKHYPGHGDTDRDSHSGLPTLTHSLQRLIEVELVPFQMAAWAGAQAVMTAHIAFPWLDTKPATMSPLLLSRVLREKGQVELKVNGRSMRVPGLGFDGVIITDALEMGAIIRQFGVGEAAVQAIEAGADMVITGVDAPSVNELWQECFGRDYTAADQWTAYDAIFAAVQSGRISRERLAASVGRILKLMGGHPLELANDPSELIRTADHTAVAQEIADAAVTVVRAEPKIGLKHLKSTETVLVVYLPFERLTPADNSYNDLLRLDEEIAKYHPTVKSIFVAPDDENLSQLDVLKKRKSKILVAPDLDSLMDQARSAGRIIIGTYFAQHSKFQAKVVKTLLKANRSVIVVALGNPYDLTAFPQVKNYLATYSVRAPSISAVAKVLAGKLIPAGRLPVSIPGFSSCGSGLTQVL